MVIDLDEQIGSIDPCECDECGEPFKPWNYKGVCHTDMCYDCYWAYGDERESALDELR